MRFAFSVKTSMKKLVVFGLYTSSFAAIAFVLALPFLEDRDKGWNYEWISLCSAIFVWLMILGLIGLFRKFFSNESPKIRFVSDSAYWLYIAHLPLIQLVQFWVSEWSLPSFIKLIFVCNYYHFITSFLQVSNTLFTDRNHA